MDFDYENWKIPRQPTLGDFVQKYEQSIYKKNLESWSKDYNKAMDLVNEAKFGESKVIFDKLMLEVDEWVGCLTGDIDRETLAKFWFLRALLIWHSDIYPASNETYQEIISCFDKAIKLNNKNGEYWSKKTSFLLTLRQHDSYVECIEVCDSALKTIDKQETEVIFEL